jgi:hypothetical protein
MLHWSPASAEESGCESAGGVIAVLLSQHEVVWSM